MARYSRDILSDLLTFMQQRTPCPYCGVRAGEVCRSFREDTGELGNPHIGEHKARKKAAHALWQKLCNALYTQPCELCKQPLGNPNRSRTREYHKCGETLNQWDHPPRYGGGIDRTSKKSDNSNLVAGVVLICGALRSEVDKGSRAAELVEQLIGVLELEELPPTA